MIKTGIIGADTPFAGELLRILRSHPEVEIETLFAPSAAGRQVSSLHHGFIGESIVNFSATIDPAILDLIFISPGSDSLHLPEGLLLNYPDLKIIDASGIFDENSDFVYGLSEINRKSLVRGAKFAVLGTPATILSIIALFPLAKYLLLNGNISIEVAAPEDVVESLDTAKSSEQIRNILKNVQSSFEGVVSLTGYPNKSQRVMRVRTSINCSLDIEEINKLYNDTYDDHNFSFIYHNEVEGKEVEGTQKTIIHLSKPEPGSLTVEIVGDCRLRGGAGDAVHVMNLLFALYEKIGLDLKPSRFADQLPSTSKSSNWFG